METGSVFEREMCLWSMSEQEREGMRVCIDVLVRDMGSHGLSLEH